MKLFPPLFSRSLACLGATLVPIASSSGGEKSITEFEEAENKKLEWNITNDGVMGGLSKGKVEFTDAGTMRFSGTLSLENNGGFSTVRTGGTSFDLSEYEGVVLRVKGDGRTYDFRANSTALYRGMAVSFSADVETTKGEWREVKVPFTALEGSWRGRQLPDETFDPSNVSRLGILLGDKKPGKFEIEVDWIRAYGGGSDAETIVDLALADGRFKTLAAALTEAELVSLLQSDGPFTVFAPTDEAFAKLPEGTVESLLKPENRGKLVAILKYHVVAGSSPLDALLKAGKTATAGGDPVPVSFGGGKVKVGEAALVDANIEASNGIIHVIDSVLLPPERGPKSLVETAKAAGTFSTLLAAAEAAGLVSALDGEGPVTVFAPTDEAFAKLPKGIVESLLEKKNIEKLKTILAYHVVSGRVTAGDALNAGTAGSFAGQPLEIGFDGGRLQVNGANITSIDIECSNGIIHVIDGVLLPPEPKKVEVEKETTCARELIVSAIEKGVPLFNDGDAGACAEVYRKTLETLAGDETISSEVRQMIAGVLKHGGREDDDHSRAWLYRRSLDGMIMYLDRAG